MGRLLRRFGYELVLLALVGFILVAGLFVVTVIVPDLQRATSAVPPTANPSPSSRSLVMSWLELPADADCTACHLTEQGGVGVRVVPAIAHPLRGWTNCTACHANDRLVATAPGHSGIHATDCLICHQPTYRRPCHARTASCRTRTASTAMATQRRYPWTWPTGPRRCAGCVIACRTRNRPCRPTRLPPARPTASAATSLARWARCQPITPRARRPSACS